MRCKIVGNQNLVINYNSLLDGLDLEVEPNQGEHEALEVLHEVVEAPEAVRVPALVHVDQAPYLGRREADVLVTNDDLQLLPAHPVRLRPQGVILSHDLALLNG